MMEFLPSFKLWDANDSTNLSPKMVNFLKDTIITSVKVELEIKKTLFNIVWELSVTLNEIKKGIGVNFIVEKKKNLNGSTTESEVNSICKDVLM